MSEVKKLVDKFLCWPVPDSVNCDPCMGGDCKIRYVEQWPNSRSGTSMLNAIEAEQMIQYLLKDYESELSRQNKILVTALKRVKAGLELTEGRFRNTVETIANRDHLNHINEALKSCEALKETGEVL